MGGARKRGTSRGNHHSSNVGRKRRVTTNSQALSHTAGALPARVPTPSESRVPGTKHREPGVGGHAGRA
eukprot:88899-Alexandrium_andersonii.AAC.1